MSMKRRAMFAIGVVITIVMVVLLLENVASLASGFYAIAGIRSVAFVIIVAVCVVTSVFALWRSTSRIQSAAIWTLLPIGAGVIVALAYLSTFLRF